MTTPDDTVCRVAAGHYVAAQRAGVAAAKPRERVDIAVSVGHAHDGDFWQASKGLYGAEALVRDGGTLLLVAPCPEGIGPHGDYLERIGRDNNRAVLEAILTGRAQAPADPRSLGPAGMMARLRRRFRAAIVSPGLSREDLAPAGYEKFEDVQSGVANTPPPLSPRTRRGRPPLGSSVPRACVTEPQEPGRAFWWVVASQDRDRRTN